MAYKSYFSVYSFTNFNGIYLLGLLTSVQTFKSSFLSRFMHGISCSRPVKYTGLNIFLCCLLSDHLTIVLQQFSGYELVGYLAILDKDQGSCQNIGHNDFKMFNSSL